MYTHQNFKVQPDVCIKWGSLINCNAVTVQIITAHGRSSNSTQTIWISPPQLVTVYSNSSFSYSKIITLKAKQCFVSVSSVLTTCSQTWKNRHKFHFQNLFLEPWIMYISALVLLSVLSICKIPKRWTPETALGYYIATHCCYYIANPLCNIQPYVKCMVCYFTIEGGKSQVYKPYSKEYFSACSPLI